MYITDIDSAKPLWVSYMHDITAPEDFMRYVQPSISKLFKKNMPNFAGDKITVFAETLNSMDLPKFGDQK